MDNKELCMKVVEALCRRGFEAQFAANGAEAAEIVMQEAQSARTVSWGGSETIKEIGVRDRLSSGQWEVKERSSAVDLFLLSANAVLDDGRIVNIDGNGNRVAASISGPGRVLYVVGVNKIVQGSLDDAIARIKKYACPPNCRRLGKKTPCAATSVCSDCDSPDRICKVTVVFDRRPTRTPVKVIVVDEPLGY